MSPHPPPQPGDVVVRHDRRQNVDLHVLRTVPGTDQYLLGSRDEAIVHATGYAKDRGASSATPRDDGLRAMIPRAASSSMT